MLIGGYLIPRRVLAGVALVLVIVLAAVLFLVLRHGSSPSPLRSASPPSVYGSSTIPLAPPAGKHGAHGGVNGAVQARVCHLAGKHPLCFQRPSAGILVTARSLVRRTAWRTRTHGGGVFTLNLAPGIYTISVPAVPGPLSRRSILQVTVRAGVYTPVQLLGRAPSR